MATPLVFWGLVADVANGRLAVVGSGGGFLLPGVGVDSGKVAGDARAGVLGNTSGLK